jgi:hypothetical protein
MINTHTFMLSNGFHEDFHPEKIAVILYKAILK